MAEQVPFAVLLHGAIGVGKTTLGKALARHLGGSYIDSDQFQHAGRPWFASIRKVAGELVRQLSAPRTRGRLQYLAIHSVAPITSISNIGSLLRASGRSS